MAPLVADVHTPTQEQMPQTTRAESSASEWMRIFPESSFFQENRAPLLPSPADIRAINNESHDGSPPSFDCPPPVMIPSLGLVVKYGGNVKPIEAQTQVMLRDQLQGRVPVPEIFGWVVDDDQTFIYMALTEGETLLDRWDSLSKDELQSICEELRQFVNAFRALDQDSCGCYIGSLCGQPLNDIFLANHPALRGPFQGPNAIEQFHDACEIDIDHETHVVFTHNDLLPPNIMLSPGPNPKVAAIVDWAQAGWYPAYWEYCKARWIRVNPRCFSDDSQEAWRTTYLPMIVDPVDDETCYHPWLYFVLSKGM